MEDKIMSDIVIQIQDINGNWLTVQTSITADDRYIASLLDQAQSSYPGKRARALIDGRLFDIRD